jgi:hypothetical protein
VRGNPGPADNFGAKETMNRFVTVLLLACSVFVISAGKAAAQGATWADRGYINIGWGVESGSSTMTDTKTGPIYDETATITSSATFTSGSLFDVAVGLRIWRNFTVGAGYHQEQNDTEGKMTGAIPSPIFFNRPRQLDQSVALDRKEAATHLMLGWVVPIGAKFDVMVYGGPSFFRLTQDAVSDVVPVENSNNFSTVAADETITTRKKSQTGFNAGVDATYIVWQNDSVRLGAGGFVRFTQADVNVEMLSSSQPTKVGGVQFGFGGRLRF